MRGHTQPASTAASKRTLIFPAPKGFPEIGPNFSSLGGRTGWGSNLNIIIVEVDVKGMSEENQEKGEDSSCKEDLEKARREVGGPAGATARRPVLLHLLASLPGSMILPPRTQPPQNSPTCCTPKPSSATPPLPITSAGAFTTLKSFSCSHIPGHHPLSPNLLWEPALRKALPTLLPTLPATWPEHLSLPKTPLTTPSLHC